jgi:hypothetical protein
LDHSDIFNSLGVRFLGLSHNFVSDSGFSSKNINR